MTVHSVHNTCIVSTVRQFWKLGTAVREPGARSRRVRAPRPWSSLVNRNYHVKHAKVAGTTVTTVLACLRSLAHDDEFVPAFEMDAFDSDVMAESGDSDDE